MKTLTKEHKRKISEARKGQILSEETKRKISEAKKGIKTGLIPKNAFQKGSTPWLKGRKQTPKVRKKMSEFQIKRFVDKTKHPMWKGGISKDSHSLSNPLYKQWRSDVFERDNWTCQACGIRGAYLEPHHIRSWSKYPELRFVLENGVTLCKNCHGLTDNYKGKGNYYA